MANGIMTGTGIETDPYLIEDCYDFLAMNDTTTYGNGNYFKLVSDIDFNDHETYRFGFNNEMIINRTAILDGNNKSIRNLILKNYSSTRSWIVFGNSGLIKNCDMVNVIFINCVSSYGFIQNNIQNCNMGISLHNSNTFSVFKGFQKTDCTYNIKGYLTNETNVQFDCQMERVHINLDLKIVASKSNGLFYHSSSFKDSYITGRVENVGSNVPYSFFSQFAMNNSYIAVDYIDPNTTELTATDSNITTVSFIDTDLLNGITLTTETDKLYLLTTEQCKDAAYLQEIGFLAV